MLLAQDAYETEVEEIRDQILRLQYSMAGPEEGKKQHEELMKRLRKAEKNFYGDKR